MICENVINIFLGLMYYPADENRLAKVSHKGLQISANKFQWGIVHGLAENMGESIYIINNVPIGSYPSGCNVLLERESCYREGLVNIKNLGFINLPVVKQLQRAKKAYKQVRDIIEKDGKANVIIYSLYLPYLWALSKLKKKYKRRIRYILIVPDIPGKYGLEVKNSLIRQLNRLLGKKSMKLSASADAYVLLTEHMTDIGPFMDKPHAVIEGIVDTKSVIENKAYEGSSLNEKVVLYTGAIYRALNIQMLIDAFKTLPFNSAQLWLAGTGDYVAHVISETKKNPQIKYLGFCKNEEIVKLQMKATVLVNPRSSSALFTRYSFPSKTMEYLLSGRPVVMNRLPGVPKEYEEHIFYCDNDSMVGMAAKLSEVLQMDDRILFQHGQRARDFIVKYKNARVQTEKLAKLLKSLDS